jgi:DNA invertase Pin-like site-specific DNA recombinase
VQLEALRRHAAVRQWEIVTEFVDHGMSGTRERRPALDRLMKAAWNGQFQAVVVWRFDRFARSVKHLVTALDTFRAMKVDFISLQEQFDTASPIGHAMFTMVGAMAQLERDIIRDRVRAGLDHARARGVRLGRPQAEVSPVDVMRLRTERLSIAEIARRLKCSRSTVRRLLRAWLDRTGADQAAQESTDPSESGGSHEPS